MSSTEADTGVGEFTREPGGSASGARHISVVDEIRRAIVEGEFAPGQRLVEPDLCAQYDVSRGTIRLVLFELAKEGLVEQEQHRGSRVRALSLAETIHIIEVRTAIEGYFAGRAAELATKTDLAELQRTIEVMEEQVLARNLHGYSETNAYLHGLIIGVSRNASASQIINQLRNQSARQQLRVQMSYERQEASLAEHRMIVDAIVRQDVNAACDAMHAHLRSAMSALLGLARRSLNEPTYRQLTWKPS